MIRILSLQDIQKIAAGQVIERPAHIIKELVENSIDAGATCIEISVHDGGKSRIKITDNGSGMSFPDARMSIQKHATSKLKSFDELAHLATFGFRGEALACISHVTNMTIATKQKDALEGIELTIQEGSIVSEKIMSKNHGTTITADNIFYTIPARKKFLKTTATEWNQILMLFKAFCFSYPSIHFILIHNDAPIFNCPSLTSLQDRCDQLLETNITSHLLSVSLTTETDIKITGCITNQQYGRYDRAGFYFFVNKRYVKNYQLAQAVMRGYNNTLRPQNYPVAIIDITLHPEHVDSNTNPKKEEVAFLYPHRVEQAIAQAIKNTLLNTSITQLNETIAYKKTFYTPLNMPLNAPHFFEEKEQSVFVPQHIEFTKPAPDHCISETPTSITEQIDITTYKIIGQSLQTYILLDHPEGLLMIDQHAAHERILYEEIATHFNATEVVPLLFPIIITLTFNDIQLLENYLVLLAQHGIMIDVFGKEQLRITALPVYAKEVPLQELLDDLLIWITKETSENLDDVVKKITEKLRAQLACKAAVKAGDELTVAKMQKLIQKLHTTKNAHSCPHGRPTQWLLSTHDIEKKFKRIA